MDDDENVPEDSAGIIEVELLNKFPKIQAFGLDIAGGIDRPYIKEDNGIFISAIKQNGLAEKEGSLGVGDKILQVNGERLDGLSHQEAVQLFTSNRSCVKLKIHKSRAQLLKAALRTPTKNIDSKTPVQQRRQQPGDFDNNLSGFLIGIALGCIGVVLLRRYLAYSSK